MSPEELAAELLGAACCWCRDGLAHAADKSGWRLWILTAEHRHHTRTAAGEIVSITPPGLFFACPDCAHLIARCRITDLAGKAPIPQEPEVILMYLAIVEALTGPYTIGDYIAARALDYGDR